MEMRHTHMARPDLTCLLLAVAPRIARLTDAYLQHGYTKDMIFNMDTMLAYVKKHFPVVPGEQRTNTCYYC